MAEDDQYPSGQDDMTNLQTDVENPSEQDTNTENGTDLSTNDAGSSKRTLSNATSISVAGTTQTNVKSRQCWIHCCGAWGVNLGYSFENRTRAEPDPEPDPNPNPNPKP